MNQDQFVHERARIVYLYNRTTGDAQAHLQPRFGDDAKDPFPNAQEMMKHLSAVYMDPYKVENARQEYRRLRMKYNETFTEFYMKFLRLTEIGAISKEDWRYDLNEKLTLDLRKAILSVYGTLLTHQALADTCRQTDQELRCIRESTNRIRAHRSTATSSKATEPYATTVTYFTKSTPAAPLATTLANRIRPAYSDPNRQALSRVGACFICHQSGHITKDCSKNSRISVIEEESGNNNSGKERL